MLVNNIKYYTYLIVVIILFILSCKGKNEVNDKVKLAEIYGNTLFSGDIDFNQWDTLSTKDSATLKTLFIEHWLKDQILLHNTEIDADEKETINKLTEDYRNSLIIDLIKNKLTEKNLDTIISEAEYKKYFETIKSSFKAEETIVSYKLMILSTKNKNTENLKKIWNSGELEKLTDFNFSNNEMLEINSQNWISLNDLKKKVPSQLISGSDKYSVSKK